MTKREFILAYLLNRSSTAPDLDGEGAAQQALKAWDVIEKNTICTKDTETVLKKAMEVLKHPDGPTNGDANPVKWRDNVALPFLAFYGDKY